MKVLGLVEFEPLTPSVPKIGVPMLDACAYSKMAPGIFFNGVAQAHVFFSINIDALARPALRTAALPEGLISGGLLSFSGALWRGSYKYLH